MGGLDSDTPSCVTTETGLSSDRLGPAPLGSSAALPTEGHRVHGIRHAKVLLSQENFCVHSALIRPLGRPLSRKFKFPIIIIPIIICYNSLYCESSTLLYFCCFTRTF